MPTIRECFTAKIEGEKVDGERARELREEFDTRVQKLAGEGVSEEEAGRRVAQRLLDERQRELEMRRFMAQMQAKAIKRVDEAARAAEAGKYGVDVAMTGMLRTDYRERHRGISFNNHREAVRGEIQRRMVDVLSEFRTRKAGLTQKLDNLEDMVRAMAGEKVDNQAAVELATSFRSATDYARARFNAAGGNVLEREDWVFFQSHDSSRVSRASIEEWVDFVAQRVDLDKMVDHRGLSMTRDQMVISLRESYRSISSNGIEDLGDRIAPKTSQSSVNKRANARHIHFKNADSWMEYHRKFGQGSLYDHMVASTEKYAKDIAMIEVFGPYPEATLRHMERKMDEGAAKGAISTAGKAAIKAEGKIGNHTFLQSLYRTVTGQAAIPENAGAAAFMQGTRDVITSASLGASWIPALSDLPVALATARLNDVPVTDVLRRFVGSFVTNSHEDRVLAAQLGFTVQGMASRAIGASRILGEFEGSAVTARMTDTVLRLGWLTPWTEAGRFATQMSINAHLTRSAKLGFDELTEGTRNMLIRHGIEPEEWDLIRSTQAWKDPETGAEFIRFGDVLGDGSDSVRTSAGNKMGSMFFAERDAAIITATPDSRAWLTQGQAPGTIMGEVGRSVGMFKGFALSVAHIHISRLMAQANPRTRAEYLAWTAIGMSMMGAFSLQLKDVTSGKDPRDMTKGRFWMDAALQGGSLGLMGDVIAQDHNRWGGGVTNMISPVLDRVEDVLKLTAGNVQDLAEGEDTNAGREAARFIKSNLPGQNLWYTRVAFDRLIDDQIDRLNPDRRAGYRDLERRVNKDTGQRFWSKPGRGLIPQRGPDIDKAFGQ